MARSLAELQAAFKSKASTGTSNQNWKLFYPFWKMQEGQTAVIRFLPDVDEDNELSFLVENHSHELVINGEKKTVPCLSMYGEACPICELSRKCYDEKNEEQGKKYYRKKSFIGQVIVMESPIEMDATKLVKLIDFGPKIYKQIQDGFQSGDLENIPCEFKGGYNFRIKKTKSGQYADYGTSNFAPKQSDLEDEVIAQIELYNLKDYRTAHMPRETIDAMLLAEQTGSSYTADAPAPSQAPAAKAAPAQAPAPAATPATPAASVSAEGEQPANPAGDILAQIRARAAAKKAAEAKAAGG